jgi:CRP-like cAMP-binding protein
MPPPIPPAPSADETQQLLMQGGWFAGLPLAARQHLVATGRVVALTNHQPLFARGDACDGIYAVLTGAMLVQNTSADGRDNLVALITPPNWLGEISVIDDGPRTHWASARGPARVLWVPRAALDDWLAHDPEGWRHLARLLTHKMRVLMRKLEDLALRPAATRLARELFDLAHHYGTRPAGDGPIPIWLNQEELAAMLSLTRQTVSELLADLQRQGVVQRRYGSMEVLDLVKLKALADHTG